MESGWEDIVLSLKCSGFIFINWGTYAFSEVGDVRFVVLWGQFFYRFDLDMCTAVKILNK